VALPPEAACEHHAKDEANTDDAECLRVDEAEVVAGEAECNDNEDKREAPNAR